METFTLITTLIANLLAIVATAVGFLDRRRR